MKRLEVEPGARNQGGAKEHHARAGNHGEASLRIEAQSSGTASMAVRALRVQGWPPWWCSGHTKWWWPSREA